MSGLLCTCSSILFVSGEKHSFPYGILSNLAIFGASVVHDRSGENRRLWVAKIDENIIAGILCFYWSSHTVVWHGAGLERYNKYRANTLLCNHAIMQTSIEGRRFLDSNPCGGISETPLIFMVSSVT